MSSLYVCILVFKLLDDDTYYIVFQAYIGSRSIELVCSIYRQSSFQTPKVSMSCLSKVTPFLVGKVILRWFISSTNILRPSFEMLVVDTFHKNVDILKDLSKKWVRSFLFNIILNVNKFNTLDYNLTTNGRLSSSSSSSNSLTPVSDAKTQILKFLLFYWTFSNKELY